MVDKVEENEELKNIICGKLDEYCLLEQVKVVGTDCYEVSLLQL